jgi:hypothetical protein
MPVFSFLFVFVIIYAILFKTKIIGESKFILLLVSFIISIVFMSVSSLELYIRTIMPWFVILFVAVFLILLIAGLATKKLDDMMTNKFAWGFIIVLIVIFVIAAIKVFNPVFHPDLGIASGGEGTSMIQQIREYFGTSKVIGSILLIIVAVAVSWILARKK